VSACFIDDGKYEEATAGYTFLLQYDSGAITAYLDYSSLLVRMNRKKISSADGYV